MIGDLNRKLKFQQDKKINRKFIVSIVIILSLFIAIFGINKYVGYVNYHAASGGQVTELVITYFNQTFFWAGFYGIALREPQFNATIDHNVYGGRIDQKILLFQCMQPNIENEIYTSIKPVSQLNFSQIYPANLTKADLAFGIDPTSADSITKTFNGNFMNLSVGPNMTLRGIPSTYTYQFNGVYNPPNQMYDLGIIEDANGNFIFVTHKKLGYIASYSPEFPQINYQLIIPVNYSGQKWYFFTDPFDVCPAGNLTTLQPGSIEGYVRDNQTLLPMYNVSISIAGSTVYTDETGYYIVSSLEGENNIIAVKERYENYVSPINITAGTTQVHNFSMRAVQPIRFNGTVIGYVIDNTTGLPMFNVSVSLAGTTTTTNLYGFYKFHHPISKVPACYNAIMIGLWNNRVNMIIQAG